jgi:hypothetical protein
MDCKPYAPPQVALKGSTATICLAQIGNRTDHLFCGGNSPLDRPFSEDLLCFAQVDPDPVAVLLE